MKRQTEIMTPEKAEAILKDNVTPLKRENVEKLKNKILRGEWVEDNGDFIQMSGKKVINGHHRLKAIAESGKTINVRIQYN